MFSPAGTGYSYICIVDAPKSGHSKTDTYTRTHTHMIRFHFKIRVSVSERAPAKKNFKSDTDFGVVFIIEQHKV